MRAHWVIISTKLCRPLSPGVLIVFGCCAALPALPSISAYFVWPFLLCLIAARAIVLDRQLLALRCDVGADPSAEPFQAIRAQVRQLLCSGDALAQRLSGRHAISGLPTRETLIAALGSAEGVLAMIEIVDFDRLCAIDPERAEAVVEDVAQRIAKMVGTQRLVAHVDRARFAIWFANVSQDTAQAEFAAISYALQGRRSSNEGDMQPAVRTGQLYFDSGAGAPEMFLARAFSMLSATPASAPACGASLDWRGSTIMHDFSLEQDLRKAIANRELELWFQPFIDTSIRAVCGAEALLRWRHPEKGLISPATFIPIAESAGLIRDIGLWVLNAACREAQGWLAADLGMMKVAVNVSAHQLKAGDFCSIVERTIAQHALPSHLLELELTESVAAVDSQSLQDLFAQLRSLGVSISIDDFGTGYSSLSYLKNLSFNKLKIDREFVTDVDQRPDNQAICQSIIALGRGLGIVVLAEGVERSEESQWLQSRGCHLFQGFHFAKPMPSRVFKAFVKSRSTLSSPLPSPVAELQNHIKRTIAL